MADTVAGTGCGNLFGKVGAAVHPIFLTVNNFIQFYQIYIPTSAVTPKMLILTGQASHVVPFLKRWCIGFGFLAREQGFEISRVYVSFSEL